MRKLFLAFVTVLLLGPSPAPAQQKLDKLVLTMPDGMIFLPLFVARGGDFFSKRGIELEVVTLSNGTAQAASILGGDADATSLSFIHAVQSRNEGGGMVAFAAVFNDFGLEIALSSEAIKKAGIEPNMSIDEKVKRLSGMKLGITSPGSSIDAFTRALFKARGYDPDKVVSLQPLGSGPAMIAAMEKKLVDGVVYAAPIPEVIEQRKLGTIVISTLRGDVPELREVPNVVLATSRATLGKKRELLNRLTLVLSDVQQFMQTHPEETAKLARKYFASVDQDIYDRIVQDHRNASAKTPIISKEKFDKLLAWMNLLARSPISLKLEDVVDSGPATTAADASKLK